MGGDGVLEEAMDFERMFAHYEGFFEILGKR